MPLGDQSRTLLVAALRDPLVVARYRAKMVEVPGSDCRGGVGPSQAEVTVVFTLTHNRRGQMTVGWEYDGQLTTSHNIPERDRSRKSGGGDGPKGGPEIPLTFVFGNVSQP